MGGLVNSFYFGQAVGTMSSSYSVPPCCKKCGLVFGEIVRLQQAIEKIEINLMDQVNKLKNSLLASIPPDYQEDPLKISDDFNSLEQIREQLLSSVRETTISKTSIFPLRHRITTPGPLSRRKCRLPPQIPKLPVAVPSKKPKEYQPCSVILERIPVPGRQTPRKTYSFPKPTIKTDFAHKISKADSDQDFVPSPQTGSNHNNDYDDNDDDDDYPWETEAPPINEDIIIKKEPDNSSLSPPTKAPTQKPLKPGQAINHKFYIISSDLLLYQTTLIKVSQGYTCFTCQEPNCPSPIYSDPSLNWNSLFTQIATHINSTHPTNGGVLTRQCPLCNLDLTAGLPFRHHLTGSKGHSIEMVACEICWKPIRNVSDYYKNHQWHHKKRPRKN